MFSGFVGVTENNLSLSDVPLSLTDVFPQFNSVSFSWQSLANPAIGYADRGPGVMIAGLEAKRIALGI